MIYFDNSASTPLTPAVKEAFLQEIEHFANPSSLHSIGFEAEKRMTRARQSVAEALGAREDEIVFTSGGTEADNLAIFGAVQRLRRRGNRILSTDSEHPAVEECLKQLEEEGFEVVRLATRGGALSLEEIDEAANEKTILAAVMHTNNETGAIYDVSSLSRIVKRKNPQCLVFSDAVQGFLKSPLSPQALGVDLLSLSSHKVHGPKGVGALWVKKGVQLPPRIFGGGQERGLRSGTENLPGIVAFGEAVREGGARAAAGRKIMSDVRQRIIERLSGEEKVVFNLPKNPSCHILSMQVTPFRSEVLLHTLSQKGIFVSSGSACSSHKGKSGVLKNFGLSDKEQDCTIRLSFSPLNTLEEADIFCKVLKEVIG